MLVTCAQETDAGKNINLKFHVYLVFPLQPKHPNELLLLLFCAVFGWKRDFVVGGEDDDDDVATMHFMPCVGKNAKQLEYTHTYTYTVK